MNRVSLLLRGSQPLAFHGTDGRSGDSRIEAGLYFLTECQVDQAERSAREGRFHVNRPPK